MHALPQPGADAARETGSAPKPRAPATLQLRVAEAAPRAWTALATQTGAPPEKRIPAEARSGCTGCGAVERVQRGCSGCHADQY